MEGDLQKRSELLYALNDADFLLKTKLQLIKDFAKASSTFPLNFELEVNDKSEIELLIANEVATISEKGERQLLQLLYAVDLSEKVFLELTLKPNFLERISEQILLREAYKVWLRTNYSK